MQPSLAGIEGSKAWLLWAWFKAHCGRLHKPAVCINLLALWQEM